MLLTIGINDALKKNVNDVASVSCLYKFRYEQNLFKSIPNGDCKYLYYIWPLNILLTYDIPNTGQINRKDTY